MNSVLASLVLTSFAALAADVTAKYTGTVEFTNPNGQSQKSEVYMDLKQDGEKLTGAAGPSETETFPITNGKVEGNTITFDVTPHNGPLIKVTLTYAGGKLKGEGKPEPPVAEMKAIFELARK